LGECVSVRAALRAFYYLLLVAGLAGLVRAADTNQAVTVDADKVQFDKPANLIIGEGNVVAQYQGAVLRADRVRFNTATKEAWAEGHVRLNRDQQEWVAPAVYYNFATQTFRTDLAKGAVNSVFVRGEQIASTRSNRADIAAVWVTTCDYDQPHYRLEARRGEVWVGERVMLYNVTVRLGNVPVLWLPVVLWSLKADAPPLTATAGHTGRWGFYVLTTSNWQLNDKLLLSTHLDERTRRGPGGGADLRYRYPNANGVVGGYYLNDNRPEDLEDDLAGRDLPMHRYKLQWQHHQVVAPELTLAVDVNKQSDRDFMQDFFTRLYSQESEPVSTVDATWRGEAFTLSAVARPQLNSFFAEVERLPEVTLAVNRMRLFGTPIFYEGVTRAGYYSNHAGDTGDLLFTGHTPRFDTFHQLLAPQLLFDRFSLVPRAGVRSTWYLEAPDTARDTNEVSRLVANLGMDASFKLWRQWDDIQSPRLRIDGLRHIIQPFADYQWVPRPDVRPDELYQFDTYRYAPLRDGRMVLVTRWTPLDFPDNIAIDAIDRQHAVRFGLRQKLQTRRDGAVWDLADIETWTDHYIEREPDMDSFSEIFTTARLRPVEWFMADVFARYDTSGGGFQELNTAMRIAHNDRWQFGVGTRRLRGDSNLLSGDLAFRLSRHWTAQIYQRFDMEDGHWEEHEYVLRQETHDWFINYGLRIRDERVGDNEVMVFCSVTLKAFPGVRIGFN